MRAANVAPTSDTSLDASGIGGHPRGLTTLFLTEFWERFSYYGMRAILILYMVAPAAGGGLEFTTERATYIYGLYTSSVYFTPIVGGWLADKFLGARRAVFWGVVVIALGHFSIALSSIGAWLFFGGMGLIALGTGLLKSNISTMVGALYSDDDRRRDGGFSIFYMGINLGSFSAPIVCGFLAQSDSFRGFLSGMGLAPESSWHWGFGAAGVGMVFGLIQ